MEKNKRIEDASHLSAIFGNFDENIKLLEKELSVKVILREHELKISGDEGAVEMASNIIDNLSAIAARGENITTQQVSYIISMVQDGNGLELVSLGKDVICVTAKGKPIKAKTLGQRNYIQAIKNNPIVFSIGPAGTGKTYLAVALAVTAFRNKDVSKIILTRPAVEAGESLGFLPGDLQEKVDPYLRPLYDALSDMLGFENFQKHVEKGSIEVAPLAYMRGRTLDDAFIILDEAQNTTAEQMKMFLTRMGFNSRVVVTGDITQIDLPRDRKSGLKEAELVLKNIDDIAFCYLNETDVVRHPLVQKIVKAYDKYSARKQHSEKKKFRRPAQR